MNLSTSNEEKLRQIFSKEEVERKIEELSEALICHLLKNWREKEEIVVLVNLEGARFFGQKIYRNLSRAFPPRIVTFELCKICSYSGKLPGEIKIEQLPRKSLKGKHVVLVEDIIDTGQTISYLLSLIKNLSPLSLTVCVLVQKIPSNFQPDFVGFKVNKKDFLVGSGLDFNGKYRELEGIYALSL